MNNKPIERRFSFVFENEKPNEKNVYISTTRLSNLYISLKFIKNKIFKIFFQISSDSATVKYFQRYIDVVKNNRRSVGNSQKCQIFNIYLIASLCRILIFGLIYYFINASIIETPTELKLGCSDKTIFQPK